LESAAEAIVLELEGVNLAPAIAWLKEDVLGLPLDPSDEKDHTNSAQPRDPERSSKKGPTTRKFGY
jgi:hypothetical protein